MQSLARLAGWFVSIAALCLAPPALAGELDPPAGPVSPTMKNLDDVSPRTIIRNDPDPFTPIVITQSGSYYLGEDIFALPGQHGIEITVSNVTLDLNGFRVQGNTEVLSLDGIVATSIVSNIVVKNGSVAAFADGVDLSSASGCRVKDLYVTVTSSQGIRVGSGSVVSDCRVNAAGGIGILITTGSVAERCVVTNSEVGFATSGPALLRDCLARGGAGDGFVIVGGSRIVSCVSENAGGRGYSLGPNCSAIDSTARGSGAEGFSIGPDSAIESCVAEDNVGGGFVAPFGQVTFSRCVAGGSSNGSGFDAGVGSMLVDCQARENSSDGIRISDDSQVIRCVAIGNGSNGIWLMGAGEGGALIQDCATSGNTNWGIRVASFGNAIVGNVLTGGDDYFIGAGNGVGTIQNNPAIAERWDNLDF